MNAVNVGAWNANWAWSLPLIVLNVVIHVIGLGLINESVIGVLSGALAHRRFMPTFAVVMGVAALLATVLHGIETATEVTQEPDRGPRSVREDGSLLGVPLAEQAALRELPGNRRS